MERLEIRWAAVLFQYWRLRRFSCVSRTQCDLSFYRGFGWATRQV